MCSIRTRVYFLFERSSKLWSRAQRCETYDRRIRNIIIMSRDCVHQNGKEKIIIRILYTLEHNAYTRVGHN